MKENQRDALTHLGLALTTFGLISSNLISGLSYWIMIITTVVFLGFAIYENFFMKK